jgi:hypothetical protein
MEEQFFKELKEEYGTSDTSTRPFKANSYTYAQIGARS